MGWGNNRAVSEVLGAILLFGIVVLALGSYQAFVVPQQNAEIESNHDAQVSNEFAEIQPAISNAAASGRTRTTSVTLGTRYPVRAAALNPPTVTGQLSTNKQGNVTADGLDSTTLEDICGLPPETQAITYKANYNELGDTGAFAYENGVTYRDAGNGILIKNEQEFVDDSRIRLFPLVGDGFSTGSSSSEQLRFVPGKTGVQTVTVDGDGLNVTFPSRLTASTWKNEILDDTTKVSNFADSGDNVTVTFEPGSYTIECTPVGIGSEPEQGPVPNPDTNESRDDEFNEINPGTVGEVVLYNTSELSSGGGESEKKNNKNVSIWLEDKTEGPEEPEIEVARLNYFSGTSPGRSNENGVSRVTFPNNRDIDLVAGREYKELDNPIQITGREEIKLNFDGNVQNDDFYVITLEYSNGNTSTYFISHP